MNKKTQPGKDDLSAASFPPLSGTNAAARPSLPSSWGRQVASASTAPAPADPTLTHCYRFSNSKAWLSDFPTCNTVTPVIKTIFPTQRALQIYDDQVNLSSANSSFMRPIGLNVVDEKYLEIVYESCSPLSNFFNHFVKKDPPLDLTPVGKRIIKKLLLALITMFKKNIPHTSLLTNVRVLQRDSDKLDIGIINPMGSLAPARSPSVDLAHKQEDISVIVRILKNLIKKNPPPVYNDFIASLEKICKPDKWDVPILLGNNQSKVIEILGDLVNHPLLKTSQERLNLLCQCAQELSKGNNFKTRFKKYCNEELPWMSLNDVVDATFSDPYFLKPGEKPTIVSNSQSATHIVCINKMRNVVQHVNEGVLPQYTRKPEVLADKFDHLFPNVHGIIFVTTTSWKKECQSIT